MILEFSVPASQTTLMTANEAASVTGVPLRQVHRIIDAGLLGAAVKRRDNARLLASKALVGLKLAHETADVLTLWSRRAMVATSIRRRLDGLTDRSWRPYRRAKMRIVRLKQDKPSWAHRRSERSWRGSIRMCIRRRSVRCMRFSIATAWSSAEWRGGTEPRERHFPFPASPTTCGAPITRASSYSPIGATATRSPGAYVSFLL